MWKENKLPFESESFRAQVTYLSSLLERFQSIQLFLMFLISNFTIINSRFVAGKTAVQWQPYHQRASFVAAAFYISFR